MLGLLDGEKKELPPDTSLQSLCMFGISLFVACVSVKKAKFLPSLTIVLKIYSLFSLSLRPLQLNVAILNLSILCEENQYLYILRVFCLKGLCIFALSFVCVCMFNLFILLGGFSNMFCIFLSPGLQIFIFWWLSVSHVQVFFYGF